MLLEGGRGYDYVIEIHCTGLVNKASKDRVHKPLKGRRRIAETKGEDFEQATVRDEGSFWLRLFSNSRLPITLSKV